MARYRISTRLDEVAEIDTALRQIIEPGAFWLSADERMAARLGLHELLVNVARHAYLNGEGDIDVEIYVTPDAVAVNVVDGGVPWAGSLNRELPTRPSTSGYGIPIILAAYDDARYCRSANRNHWSLRLYRSRRDGVDT